MGLFEEIKKRALSTNMKIGNFLEARIEEASFIRLFIMGIIAGVSGGAYFVLNTYGYNSSGLLVVIQQPLAVFSVFAEYFIISNFGLLLGALTYIISSQIVKKLNNNTRMKRPDRFQAIYTYFVAFAIIMVMGIILATIDRVFLLPWIIYLTLESIMIIFILYLLSQLLFKLYHTSIAEFFGILVLSHVVILVLVILLASLEFLAGVSIIMTLKFLHLI